MSVASLSTAERVGVITMRRVRALGWADQLRLVATALILFLLVDFVRLTLTTPLALADASLVVAMDAVAYVSLAVALWRPRLGLGLAAIPLLSTLFWTSTSMDALLLLAVTALGLAQVDRRTAALTSLALVAFVVARVLLAAGSHPLGVGATLGISLLTGLALGWAGLILRERREESERSAAHLAGENARIRADERRTLSRELHDVVAHQLSTASLQVMGARGVEDPVALQRVLGTVDRATAEALSELRLLVRVLRDDPATAASGTEIRELAEQLTPTQAAAAAELALIQAGFEADIRVPARADTLEMTVQRTLGRVIREATANVIAHAPARCRCTIAASVTDQQVTLRVSNPMPADAAEPSLGWGLRGLNERVELTGGQFSTGVTDGTWSVAVSLPHS